MVFGTVKVSKVKGHATHATVAGGDVRLEDLVGNNGVDAGADLGRLRQHDDVITARRDLLRVRRLWYPIMLDFHRFMVAISRIEVNHDGFWWHCSGCHGLGQRLVSSRLVPLLSSDR